MTPVPLRAVLEHLPQGRRAVTELLPGFRAIEVVIAAEHTHTIRIDQRFARNQRRQFFLQQGVEVEPRVARPRSVEALADDLRGHLEEMHEARIFTTKDITLAAPAVGERTDVRPANICGTAERAAARRHE